MTDHDQRRHDAEVALVDAAYQVGLAQARHEITGAPREAETLRLARETRAACTQDLLHLRLNGCEAAFWAGEDYYGCERLPEHEGMHTAHLRGTSDAVDAAAVTALVVWP